MPYCKNSSIVDKGETFEQQTIFIKPGFMPDFFEIPIRDRSDVAGWR